MGTVLDIWKGRLRTAEAVLDAPSGKVSEQLVKKTLAAVVDALRGSIERLETTARESASIRDSARMLERQFELFFRTLPIASLTTSLAGYIVAANPEAAALLNTSARHLIGKSVLLFFEDRDACLTALGELRESGAAIRQSITLRPRERAPRRMRSCIARLDADMLQWFLLPDSRNTKAPV